MAPGLDWPVVAGTRRWSEKCRGCLPRAANKLLWEPSLPILAKHGQHPTISPELVRWCPSFASCQLVGGCERGPFGLPAAPRSASQWAAFGPPLSVGCLAPLLACDVCVATRRAVLLACACRLLRRERIAARSSVLFAAWRPLRGFPPLVHFPGCELTLSSPPARWRVSQGWTLGSCTLRCGLWPSGPVPLGPPLSVVSRPPRVSHVRRRSLCGSGGSPVSPRAPCACRHSQRSLSLLGGARRRAATTAISDGYARRLPPQQRAPGPAEAWRKRSPRRGRGAAPRRPPERVCTPVCEASRPRIQPHPASDDRLRIPSSGSGRVSTDSEPIISAHNPENSERSLEFEPKLSQGEGRAYA